MRKALGAGFAGVAMLEGLVSATNRLAAQMGDPVLEVSGARIDGLFVAGACAGFGSGGFHGYNALEETFLGGRLFSGRSAGRAAAGQGG